MNSFVLPFEAPIIELEERIEELRRCEAQEHVDLKDEIRSLESKQTELIEQIYANLTPWDRVRIARHQDRPIFNDYAKGMMDEFVEIHGDRAFGDDRSIIAGLGRIEGRRVVLIGQQKGSNTKEKIEANFGMPHPEGLRKAKRMMLLAEKYHLPVITIIDTPGAYPGIGAEERGISYAIADNLFHMARLRTPILSVIIGEGCSGGALAIGMPDKVMMLEYAYYAVISPEGCAAILWRSGEKAPLAAAAMRLTAQELLEVNVIDQIIPEPTGGAHRDPKKMIATLKKAIGKSLDQLCATPIDQLVQERYQKYRRIGVFFEGGKLSSCLRKTCKRKILGAAPPKPKPAAATAQPTA
ncbi:MAG TPA: acetyl-CoA carboxylase carboxyltransferase subunit alpha [Candidatus Brocadiia bacterium]|nr:acetyl-CoA carboxylase carboxyltransferase subunit alpha [Candidatus Brocadiia bacterium]